MAYADYTFYTETYKGTLSEAAFGRLSERASDYIDARTNYVLKKSGIPAEYEERVMKCCCALAEAMDKNEKGGVKSSESVGNYSVSYAVNEKASASQRLDEAFRLYLNSLAGAVWWV